VLAVHERREPPGGDPAIELPLLLCRELSPVVRAEYVDELVGNHALPGVDGRRPRDVLRGVPLIPLGVFVELAQLGLVYRVILAKDHVRLRADDVGLVHGGPPSTNYPPLPSRRQLSPRFGNEIGKCWFASRTVSTIRMAHR